MADSKWRLYQCKFAIFLQLLWNLVHEGFWGRWLQIWYQNCKVKKGRYISQHAWLESSFSSSDFYAEQSQRNKMLTSPPFSIFHFEFHSSDTRFVISDPENPHIPSFGAIAKKLRIRTNIAAILDPLFRILKFWHQILNFPILTSES